MANRKDKAITPIAFRTTDWDFAIQSISKEGLYYRGYRGAEVKGFLLEFLGLDEKTAIIKHRVESYLKEILKGELWNLSELAETFNLEKPTVDNAGINDVQDFLDKCVSVSMNNKPSKTEIQPKDRDWLNNPELLNIIDAEFNKVIVGEKETRLTLFLICVGGARCRNAAPTSSNLLVNDESGAGKDFIVRHVCGLLPPDWLVKRTRISETAFTYWHTVDKEPDWTWTGKVFYCEDISSNVLNSDPVKLLSSKSEDVEFSQITIKQKSVQIGIRGKPAMIVTSYSTKPNQETLRRYPILNLDTSEDQTRAILDSIAEKAQTGRSFEYAPNIRRGLETLHDVNVVIPFARKLVTVLSTKNIIVRTHFSRLIDYIKFSATLYQYQRERDPSGFLIAESQDYNNARMALLKTTSNIFSIPLTKKQQKILEVLAAMSKSDPTLSWSVAEVSKFVNFMSERQIYRELDNLTALGFLERSNEERAESRKPIAVYSYLNHSKVVIPTWEELLKSK